MRGVIIRFFKFDALNTIPEVYVFAAMIYVALVTITWFSVFSLKVGKFAKLFWIVVVTFIPIVGIAIYCVFCLYKADYSYLKRFGMMGRHH
jgi:hypothetical protein